jgi:ATP-dependent DNA ligase
MGRIVKEKMDQCRWVAPKLVCQVAFLEWTDAGHLRHCTFVAMRDDKKGCRGGSRNLSSPQWKISTRLYNTDGTKTRLADR